jgi:hypothetical protein
LPMRRRMPTALRALAAFDGQQRRVYVRSCRGLLIWGGLSDDYRYLPCMRLSDFRIQNLRGLPSYDGGARGATSDEREAPDGCGYRICGATSRVTSVSRKTTSRRFQ